ncbi:cytochrome P450 71D11 [Cannabis sativa]|uniref:cytochrome P450 71D11 n=1 Tax=Cannabis sativa TaxID=3483 RepID=UPI0029CA1766|nr:cytochrome P450 71D11 [Cannabis sativa]
MEFQQIIPSFQVLLFSFFMIIVVSILLKRAQTSNNSASKLPPGPWRLPFLGNLHQLLGPLPHHTFRDLAKKHGPFMYLKIGQVPTIVVSSPEYAKEVMKVHDNALASRPNNLVTQILAYNGTDIIFAPYGQYWKEVKKICVQELLTLSRVKTFQPIREEESFNIVKNIASKVGSPINLTQMLKSLSYSIIARAAFGEKRSDHDDFVYIMKETVKLSAGFAFGDVFPSLSFLDWYTISKFKDLKLRSSRIVDRIIKLHIDDQDKEIKSPTKKSGEEEDLVDVLLRFHKSEDPNKFTLTKDNLKAIIASIFGAGSDTSSVTMELAMAEMMRNPRVMKKAQDEVREVFAEKGFVDESSINEMTYLKSVVKETLRLHPPAAMLFPRESREKCDINGYEIPMKTKILVNAWAIGRDPKYWTEPESFMPERFLESSIDFKGNNFEFIPFGAGRRICPGISFALTSIELPLAFLLYHFDWKLPNGMKPEELDVRLKRFGITVCRKKDLYLIPSKYEPPSMAKAINIK